MTIYDNKNITGIYGIFFAKDGVGKVYIGSSINIKSRFKDHIKLLKKSKHHSPHLQSAWNLYGDNYFSFKLIQPCKKENLLITEQKWMDFFLSYNDYLGFNIQPTAGNSLGRKLSQITKDKIALSHKGKRHTPEHNMAISIAGKGRKLSEETKNKMSLYQQGFGGGSAILTEEDVIEIKHKLKEGINQIIIANKYGVARQTIGNIAQGRRWKHITI